jgi:hypothetical protein
VEVEKKKAAEFRYCEHGCPWVRRMLSSVGECKDSQLLELRF